LEKRLVDYCRLGKRNKFTSPTVGEIASIRDWKMTTYNGSRINSVALLALSVFFAGCFPEAGQETDSTDAVASAGAPSAEIPRAGGLLPNTPPAGAAPAGPPPVTPPVTPPPETPPPETPPPVAPPHADSPPADTPPSDPPPAETPHTENPTGGAAHADSPSADTVLPSNSGPTITGVPANAVVLGTIYSFVPSAADANGDTLTFSVLNLPGWASFNAATGELSGQPVLADVGVYSSITISVSDGVSSAALPAFVVTVTDSALGSITLSWTPPTQNTDGTPLADLAGYKIYYGLQEGNYPTRIDISNPGIATFVVDGLPANTYYVVATSVNAFGVESTYSNVTIKTVGGS
jgi:putative Ig domain-containing protein